MSTTHPYSTTTIPDPQHGDHALYLDGAMIGFARTADEAQTLLDQLALDLPLPPPDAVADALHVLAAHDDEPAIYLEAAAQLVAGVTISATGADRLIGGVLVRRAPPLERWPWPWRCDCGERRCWHGALLDGVLFAWERLGEETRPLPFDCAAACSSQMV